MRECWGPEGSDSVGAEWQLEGWAGAEPWHTKTRSEASPATAARLLKKQNRGGQRVGTAKEKNSF